MATPAKPDRRARFREPHDVPVTEVASPDDFRNADAPKRTRRRSAAKKGSGK